MKVLSLEEVPYWLSILLILKEAYFSQALNDVFERLRSSCVEGIGNYISFG